MSDIAKRLWDTLVDSMCFLGLAFAFHQANVLAGFVVKMATGSFSYVTLFLQSFGLAEIVTAQTAPLSTTQRVLIYLAPTVGYALLLAIAIFVYTRMGRSWRLPCAWIVAFCLSYGMFVSSVGLCFQGGWLGRVEDQLGHPLCSVALFLYFLAAAVVIVRSSLFHRDELHRDERFHISQVLLALFPVIALLPYRMIWLTAGSSWIYKSALVGISCALVARFAQPLVASLLPQRSFVRLLAAIGMLVVWVALPAPDRYLRNPRQQQLQKSVRDSFPLYGGPADLNGALLIADEQCNTIFVVHADGKLETLSTDIEAPETLYYDASHERFVVSGRRRILTYHLPLTAPPVIVIRDWSHSVIECLISDEAGMLAGYMPNHLSRIREDGSIEPLLTVPSPDSILPIGNSEYLIGTTQSQAANPSLSSLYRVNTATAQIETVLTSEPVDNIEALAAKSTDEVILGIGSLSGPGMSRIATLDLASNIATIVRVADVEGMAITLTGEIVFSNDELGTVFKISRRGGLYPFVHLFDPDDIAPLR